MAFIDSLIEADGEIRLYKFDGKRLPATIFNYDCDNDSTKICFLDLETTGLDKKEDKIIELAVKIAAIDKQKGELISILNEYQSFEDPRTPIDKKVTQINGITNEMVKGHSIDWEAVSGILNEADIIVAHNAGFDRAFMDRYLPLSRDKIWACSVNDIDWVNKGFNGRGQELLCIWHGFHFDSHRAMSDVDALIYLVTHQFQDDVGRYILELLQNAYKPFYHLKIPFGYDEAKKDKAKANKYRWDKTVWSKILKDSNQIDEEVQWAEENLWAHGNSTEDGSQSRRLRLLLI